MKVFKGAACAIMLFILVACTTKVPSVEVSIVPPPASLPQPAPGKSTVTGIVVSLSNQPIPQVPVWLAEVVRQGREGLYILDSRSSPGAYTDEKGVFIIPDVTPGEYVIVVGDPEFRYEIIKEESGKAKVWNIPSDQIFEVGELKVTISGK